MKNWLAIFSVFFITQIFGQCNWAPFTGINDPVDKTVFYLFPQICVTDSGYRMAIWQRDPSSTNSSNIIDYTHYDYLSNTWTPIMVGNPPGNIGEIDPDDGATQVNQTQADLCCYSNGDAIAVWHSDLQNPVSGSGPGIVASKFSIGSISWSTAATLDLTRDSAHPKITCFESGEAVAVWTTAIQANPVPPGAQTFPPTQFSAASQVWYSIFNGTSWSAPTLLDTVRVETGLPHICGDGVENAVAIWVHQTDTAMQLGTVYARTFTLTSGWSPLITAISPAGTVYTGVDVEVGCDPFGNAVAAWAETTAAYAVVYNAGWGAPVSITPYSYPDLGNNPQGGAGTRIANIPPEIAICMTDLGNAHIVLRTKRNGVAGAPATYPAAMDTVMLEAIYYDSQTGSFSLPGSNPLAQGPAGDATYLITNPQVACGPCNSAGCTWSTDITPMAPNFTDCAIYTASFNGLTTMWTTAATALSEAYGPVTGTFMGSNYYQLQRPNIASDSFGILYPIWTYPAPESFAGAAFYVITTEGMCVPFITSLSATAITNRFPFQTECLTLLSWNYPCPTFGGGLPLQVLVNGELKETTTTPIRSALLDELNNGDIVTVQPVTRNGLVGPGTTIEIGK